MFSQKYPCYKYFESGSHERSSHFKQERCSEEGQGYFEVANTSNQGEEKAVVVWKDNGAVIMASIVLVQNQFKRLKDGIERERKKFL